MPQVCDDIQMRQFVLTYIDTTPGLRDKLIASGISKSAFADYVRGRGQPSPKKLWHICFVMSVVTNQPMHDIMLIALKMIEEESSCQDHSQKTLRSDKKQRR